MPPKHKIVPLHLSGNTTDQQNIQLQECLGEAVMSAYRAAIEQLDQQSAQSVLEAGAKLKFEVIEAVAGIVHSLTMSNKYRDEEVGSNRAYPHSYRVWPVEAQVTELRKTFPVLSSCREKLGHLPLPDGPEGWFAIPRW